MAFLIYQSGTVNYRAGDFVLQHSAWNDWWTYENLYTLKYVAADLSLKSIGQVKIGQVIDTTSPRVPELPEKFEQLDTNSFISLGQDTDYYDSLNHLGIDKKEYVLKGLNDIAFNLEFFAKFNDYKVVTNSLMRDITTSTVTNQLHRMAHGGAKLTRYHFEYHYPNGCDNENSVPQLSFSVEPDSNPPTNIHVLIGRNGVGKTWLLKNMINTLYAQDDSYGRFEFRNRRMKFANIVCLAFSVFDTFPIFQDNEGLKYTYIGVQSFSEERVLNLDEQFAVSMIACMASKSRYRRWVNTIRVLESDPVFFETGLVDCVERIQSNRSLYKKSEAENEIKEAFTQLSSGHKIVALTITRLVETVEECTLVLLDEPELHLHPPLLSAFTRALSQLLIDRNGVAIVTTHSPVILQEVPKSCVWILRKEGKDVAADRPVIETFGENVGTLTSEVFQLEVMGSGFHKMLQNVLTENNGDFDMAVDSFEGQLGAEALALLKVMAIQYGGE